MTAVAFYEQNTARFVICAYDLEGREDVVYEAVGYAGRGPHKNNPASEHIKGQGPLPRGDYRIGPGFRHPHLGPLAFPLEPHSSNEMHGRSDFLIHGDSMLNPGNASSGCIILPRQARGAIFHYHPTLLVVDTVPARAQREDLKSERSELSGTSDTR